MGEASGRNPLEVPEILENVFQCLPLEELKSARLVNKLWRDCGIAPMKKKAEGRVYMGCLTTPDDKTIQDLAELSKCLDSVAGGNANFPCSKFSFSPSLIRNDRKNRNKDESLVANFLRKISPWVTELDLSTDPQKRIFKAAFPRRVDFPKLKLLRFSTSACDRQPQGSKKISSRAFHQFIGDILEKVPSLQKVYFRDDEDSVDAIIKAKSTFTEMRIYPISNTYSMDKLSRWNREVKLKSLDLRFKSLESQLNTSLYQILRSQSDSLETLILYFCNISIRAMVSFPEMPKLKNLTIQLNDNAVAAADDEDDDDDYLVTFPVISYQRQFPALKTLHLNPRGCEGISLCKQFIKPGMPPVETIEELTLPRNYFENAKSLITAQNAVAIFPNVKKLNVSVNSAMLPTFFEHWTDLEEITLYPAGGSTDYLLMGHSRSGYKRLQRRIEREGEDFDWNQLEPGNATESILNLKKLRVLRFINGADCRKLEVTRASLHLILSRMGSLKCLDFGYRCYPMEKKIDKAWLSDLNEDCVVLWME